MEEGSESDSSLGDMLSEDATASLQLAQEDPLLQIEEAEAAQQVTVSDDNDASCEEVVPVELRSRFNAAIDKSLLAEVLSTPPFSFRACRDRTSLLLRKYAERKKRNIAASGTSEVHTDDDDVLEQLQQLKDEAVTQTQTKKSIAASKTQKVETATANAGSRATSLRETKCC
ncbi:hypothetical protein PC118_g21386 [Phytophthora cactorum]|uniref:Uncharacterized protein n=1 Tax=Phytophthora cactorum TaxID=29920 RepID=A0A8T0Z327_9STRA|nr:hypothetical protein PC113_g11630 [Phytophthora cactorum]KAG2893576.1 hypothetical protein PC117_g23743 [Phytophthora cactorum]KAG2962517.1 hypothetical protein PC118_g21386 [Phytophthora cactorum]